MLQQLISSATTKSNSFLEENHSYKLNSQAKQSQQVSQPGRPSQDMMSFWGKWYSGFQMTGMLTEEGYKFETLCLMPSIWAETSRDYIENRENEIVNNHAQYCSVVKTGIGNTVMVLGGEVDAGKFLSSLCNMALTSTSMGFQTNRR
jgi:RAT1-interacting protein